MPKRPSRGRREFWESAWRNTETYDMYYKQMVELSVTMFDWLNLPDTIDPRYMELVLYAQGQAVFFKDEELGFLCLNVATNGYWDIYQTPTHRRAYASNGYNRELNKDNSVIIYNNYLRTPDRIATNVFARRIANIDRVIDVNVNAQKTPVIIRATEQQRLTMENVAMDYDGNKPYIFADKELSDKDLQALDIGAPFVADKLYTLKTQLWNEFLTFRGISNVSFQKKERMISDEAIRSQGGTIANRYSRLEMRRQACEKINKMFDLDIWVDYRQDYREADGENMIAAESESKKPGIGTLAVDLRTN